MTQQAEILGSLPDGLILRRSTRADAEKLADFNARIHGESPLDAQRVAAWTRDLLLTDHPTFGEGDYTIVEDPKTGEIVSSSNLISQTWSYAGIPFKVGRPELVGTDERYRQRGLVRAQFEVLHRWSQERGEILQAITGIPYYYRQFGYEMCVNLGGGRIGYAPQVPQLEKDAQEDYCFRAAREDDIDFLTRTYAEGKKRALLSAEWDRAAWQYELSGKSKDNINRYEVQIIETRSGERAGYLAHPFFLWPPAMAALFYELAPGFSWYAVTPAVIRYLWRLGQLYAQAEGKEHTAFQLNLSESHPAYQAVQERLPKIRKPYAWYMRLPDVGGFLRLITPILEQRLESSQLHAYTGAFNLGFYRSGLRLNFQVGHLASVDPWQPEAHNFGTASFPGLSFLQLLFGYRSLDELIYAFPDCFCEEDLRPVLRVLFPRISSDIWPIS